jgi:hypothetical protein
VCLGLVCLLRFGLVLVYLFRLVLGLVDLFRFGLDLAYLFRLVLVDLFRLVLGFVDLFPLGPSFRVHLVMLSRAFRLFNKSPATSWALP